MKFGYLLLFASLWTVLLCTDVAATLAANKDTMIVEGGANADHADGGGAGLFAGTDANTMRHRALISFDLSSIPSGATITSVQLTLTLGQVASGGPSTATIGMFDLTQNWGEGTAGSSTLLGGPSAGLAGSGQGFTAGVGDATWNSAANQQTLWTAAGGDHAATASASLFLNNNSLNNSFTWLSTPQLVADVQGWLNSPSTNFGWELINANETSAKTLYGFYSRDWHTFPGGNASQEPSLAVAYTVPEPATGPLAACAMLFILFLRPRRRRA